MSTKAFCDICGTLIEYSGGAYTRLEPDFSVGDADPIEPGTHKFKKFNLDLCPKCCLKVEELLNKIKKEKRAQK